MVWEAYNGLASEWDEVKGKKVMVMHVNDNPDDNRLPNLKLGSLELTRKKNKRRVLEWQKKMYTCHNCNKQLKNDSKYYHNMICPPVAGLNVR